MGEALGKTQVSSSAPTVNEHNQAYSVIDIPNCEEENLLSPISGWWRVWHYLPFGEQKPLPGPHQTEARSFFFPFHMASG